MTGAQKIPKVFKRRIKIHFHETDPAGIMYFANIFTLAHGTFEEFIETTEIGWKGWFLNNTHIVPIRHAESDFFSPFFAGHSYDIDASVAEISDSTFVMQYDFQSGTTLHARVKMAHTFVDKKTKTKSSMPAEYRKVFEQWHAGPASTEA